MATEWRGADDPAPAVERAKTSARRTPRGEEEYEMRQSSPQPRCDERRSWIQLTPWPTHLHQTDPPRPARTGWIERDVGPRKRVQGLRLTGQVRLTAPHVTFFIRIWVDV
jgi:hypothetical protein